MNVSRVFSSKHTTQLLYSFELVTMVKNSTNFVVDLELRAEFVVNLQPRTNFYALTSASSRPFEYEWSLQNHNIKTEGSSEQ